MRPFLFLLALSLLLPDAALAAAWGGTTTCMPPVRRMLGGPGRRPGATVVPLSLRLEVLNAEGRFVGASSHATRAVVEGDEVLLRARISNLSLYDVAEVRIRHTFTPPPEGPDLFRIGNAEGVVEEGTGTFRINRIESDSVAEFTFRLFLSGELGEDLSESLIRLEYFEVLEPERRHPPRGSETPRERSRQTVERVGIGMTDVACFTGAPAPSRIARPIRRRSDLPPLLTPMIGAVEQPPAGATTERTAPEAVSAADAVMPKTGVELGLLYRSLEVLAGTVLALILFRIALFLAVQQAQRKGTFE